MEESQEDFEDSFLQEVTRAELLPRVPRPGARMGGADGCRFEVLEELGAGAMGHVFRAWDVELQRVVALKFLLWRRAPEEGLPGALLRQEARAVARLGHENIVRLFDVAEWSGASWEPRIPFLVMEYLEGESLADLLKRGKPGLQRTLALMGAVAAGLAHAHAHHIVHRDLKPSNVLLTATGRVKLLDFGLAHLMASTVPPIPQLPTAGTPPYMAPEQWRGEEQDARTDLWAAGVMLFELLTGELPYQANSLEHLRAQVLSPEPMPSVRARCPELPEAVARLVAELLVKEPARRLSSAAELRERLQRLEEALGPWREPSAPVASQRRQVTLVSCRLVDPGGVLASMDPEDVSDLQAGFQRFCAEVLQRHQASLALSVGDEVLGCFGHPTAREDDSERAVRSGLRLVEGFGAARPQLARLGLALQVGIHTDVVVFEAAALQGGATQVASGLSRRAGLGQVVLSGTTGRLVRGAFDVECLEGEACRVVGERQPMSRFERALVAGGLTPLVGREQELARLRSAWARARAGEGGFLLLQGEAGIGKSRLIQELWEQVAREEAALLRGQCGTAFSSSAFHPLLQMLRRSLNPEHARWVEGFLAAPAGAEPGSLLDVMESRAERKQRVLDTLRALFLGMAEERPVLLVIEDVHWADPSTLELLGHLLPRVSTARLLVLLSARPGLRLPWRGAGVHRLRLERLSMESTAALVKEAAQGRPLPEETVAQLVARTDGVPLFVEELTRRVLERGPEGALPDIPVTLQELLLTRLDALPPRQKALAQLCAVVGRSFRHGLLSRLLARDEASLREDVAGLLSAGLLRHDEEEAGDSYQFRHVLFQEAAWQSLPRSLRRQHHRRVAQTLLEHFPDLVKQQPEVLAHHFMEAGEAEQAIHYCQRAAERAVLHSTSREAVAQLKQALRLLRSLPDASERYADELYLLNALGILLMDLEGYGVPGVDETYARAMELFRQHGQALPQLELLWLGLGSCYTMTARFAEAEGLATQVIDLGQQRRDPRLSSYGHRQRAIISLYQGDAGRCREELGEAVRLSAYQERPRWGFTEKLWVYEQVDDLVLRYLLSTLQGQLREADQWGHEIQGLIRGLPHAATVASGMTYLAAGCLLRRDVQGTLEWSGQGSAVAAGPSFQPLIAATRGMYGWALVQTGRVTEGLQALQSSTELLRRLDARAFLPYFLGLLAEARLSSGQVREAQGAVEEALRIIEETGARLYEAGLHVLRGELAWRSGEVERARHAFLRAVAVARRQHAVLFELRATVRLGHLLRELGRPRGVRRRLECLLARFEPGVELVDLQEARALLSAFAGTESPPPSPTSHPG
jgi:serine/threonine protein kinase/tetratricopeptide (TPR) repeat protein